MKDDIETFVAGLLAIVLFVAMTACFIFMVGLTAKLMWIPFSLGWNLL